jgi:hypothetical protein
MMNIYDLTYPTREVFYGSLNKKITKKFSRSWLQASSIIPGFIVDVDISKIKQSIGRIEIHTAFKVISL